MLEHGLAGLFQAMWTNHYRHWQDPGPGRTRFEAGFWHIDTTERHTGLKTKLRWRWWSLAWKSPVECHWDWCWDAGLLAALGMRCVGGSGQELSVAGLSFSLLMCSAALDVQSLEKSKVA